MSDTRLLKLLALLAFTTSACGCYLRPNFGPPGTIGMQQSRAVIHDPFPSNDLGPVIEGGRPKGFERPSAETQNMQKVRNSLFEHSNNGVPAYQQNGPLVQPGF